MLTLHLKRKLPESQQYPSNDKDNFLKLTVFYRGFCDLQISTSWVTVKEMIRMPQFSRKKNEDIFSLLLLDKGVMGYRCELGMQIFHGTWSLISRRTGRRSWEIIKNDPIVLKKITNTWDIGVLKNKRGTNGNCLNRTLKSGTRSFHQVCVLRRILDQEPVGMCEGGAWVLAPPPATPQRGGCLFNITSGDLLKKKLGFLILETVLLRLF